MPLEEIDVEKIPHADLRDLIDALCDFLDVKVLRDVTPDYTAYEIKAR